MHNETRVGTPEVHVLIDGDNLWGAMQSAGCRRVDVALLRQWLSGFGHPRIEWFQAAHPHLAAFHNVLRSNGFRVHAPTPKPLPGGRLKCDMDVTLAVTALRQADRYDTTILFSGDGDFEPLVEHLIERGHRVIVVAAWGSLCPSLLAYIDPDDFVQLQAVLDLAGGQAA
jgi:hypothetical protein